MFSIYKKEAYIKQDYSVILQNEKALITLYYACSRWPPYF